MQSSSVRSDYGYVFVVLLKIISEYLSLKSFSKIIDKFIKVEIPQYEK